MFTLDDQEEVFFLGPLTHAIRLLKTKCGLTEAQARGAALQAMANTGDAVDLEIIMKIT
jgi:hypothetical protein